MSNTDEMFLYKCPICGRERIIMCPEDWVYKRIVFRKIKGKRKQRTRYLCSWTCCKKWDEEVKAQRALKKRRKDA